MPLPSGGTANYYEAIAHNVLKGEGFTYYPYRLLDRQFMIPKTFENIPTTLEDIGVDLASDTRYAIRAPVYRYPPAYPLFICACHLLFGPGPLAVVLVEILLNGLVAVMIYRLAYHYFENETLAVTAGILTAVWPFTLLNSLSYEPTSLLYVTVVGSIAAMTAYQRNGQRRFFILSGILSGLSAMLRTDALFAAFGVAAALLLAKTEPVGRKIRTAGFYLLLTAAVMSPWLIRNALVFHRFVPLSCGLGVNLVIGIGKYIPDSGFPADDRQMIYRELGTEVYKDKMHTDDGCYPDGVEREEKRVQQAKAYIRSEPVKFLISCVTRAPDLFFTGAETVSRRTGAGAGKLMRAASTLLTIAEPILFFLAILGLWVARPLWGKMSISIWAVIFYVIGHLPMWVEPRYFKPAWPFLLLFAVGVLLRLKKFQQK